MTPSSPLSKLRFAAFAALLFLAFAPARGEDIDIYAEPGSVGELPNVLLILDSSANWSSSIPAADCFYKDNGVATTIGPAEQGKKMVLRDWTSAEFWKDTSDAKIKEAIEKGVKTDKGGKKQEMDAFAAKLRPEEIDNLTAYVKTFKK